MKERKLTILLALLAALALVFAGACSDGSDDSSSSEPETQYIEIEYEYTGPYSGTTWTYDGPTTSHSASNSLVTITSVALAFADEGNSVVMTVDFSICGGSCSNSISADPAYTATVPATYTALGEYVGIVLPTGADNSDNVTALTFTASASTEGGSYDTLTLAGTNASTTAAYTVADDNTSSVTADIFGSSTVDALETGDDASAFTLPSDDSTGAEG